MSVLKGDYIGFTYNGIHSSDLGIIRTSNGSRFDENLLPTIQDKTVQVPGGDGTYYFGSYYTQRQFNVSFAFDSLSENQIEFLKSHFGDKKVHPLVFDETPYKTYMAKVTGTATIKYVPFDEGFSNRVYKGEGTIQFTCYQPYAVCEKKYLDDYENANKYEWAVASGLLKSQGKYDSVNINGEIAIYNPGVKDSDWILTINVNGATFPSGTIKVNDNYLVFSGGLAKSAGVSKDSRITFNSKTGLVEGWYIETNGYVKSGNIYNDYIVGGDFFKIPVTTTRTASGRVNKETTFTIGPEMAGVFNSLKYNYYYL